MAPRACGGGLRLALAAAVVSMCGAGRWEQPIPGLQPAHVVRLHRYDHSGVEALLEREAQWHRRSDDRDLGQIRASASGASPSFVQMSSRQTQGLREHHQSAAVVIVGMGSDGEATLQGAQGHQQRRHMKQHTHRGIQVTGLSDLQSQFLGPLGVGTVTVPEGCASSAQDAALVFMAEGAESIAQAGECLAKDESHVWVIFDTGSTNLWIASDLCNSPPCRNPKLTKYNHTKSISFEQVSSTRVDIHFGTGFVSGPMAVEDFRVGPFTVYNQSFGMIEKEEGSVFDAIPFGGILGLGFPEMAARDSVPFFDSIMKQDILDANEFCFYFSLDNPAANAILWGGVDHKFHEGDMEHFNVVERWYWSLELKALWVGDQQLLSSSDVNSLGRTPKAIVDTGTTFFSAETHLFQRIMSLLPEARCEKVTQDTHPAVVFTLENTAGQPVNFTFTNAEFMAAWDDSLLGRTCTPTFMRLDLPEEHGPGMILGEVFIRRYLTKFARGNSLLGQAKVGIARARHGREVEDHLHTLTHGQPSFPGVV